MGIKCAEDPFNMCMFFDIMPPSFWVHYQTPNTHIRAFCTVAPPPGVSFHYCLVYGVSEMLVCNELPDENQNNNCVKLFMAEW